MPAIESGWTRFYGMPVPQDVAASARERIIDTSVADLVDAHLGINYAYFGAIDKTLSGFVILDDEGDDYTLLDLRDTGQTWWQDHETRDLELRGDKHAKPARRVVATPDLCARYQWLVWQLALPMMQNGKPIQTVDYLVRNGIGRFRHLFPRKEAYEKTFAAELPALASDPHLAIYWLLHTTALADDEKRNRVVAAIGTSGPELVRAFVARLGSLPASGDIPIVPEFRSRRALAVIYGAFELADDATYAAALRALELSPSTRSLQTGLQVAAGIDRGKLEADEVAAVLARIPEETTGTELLRALLEKRGGATSSKHADTFARLAATSDDAWWSTLEGLWQVHELAYDGKALVPVTRTLVAHDRYHRRGLQMAMRAAQIAGEPFEAIEDDLEIAEGLLGPYTRLVELPDQWKQVIESLIDPALLRALAWRVLQRVELNKPGAELAAWAAGQVLSAGDAPARNLVGEAFAKLDQTTQAEVIEAAGKVIDRADHGLITVLLAFLDGPEPAENDFAAQFADKRGKEAALRALAPWFAQKPVFDSILKMVERPGGGGFVDLVFGKLFSPFEDTYVLPKLDAAQAIRVAKAMITTILRHPNIHARSAAGHELFRFNHPGAEAYLIDALTEYGVRYAAVKGPGGTKLDHGKTENDQLEDLVANLYAAVRALNTPTAKAALVERLFAERRSYWRMGNAIGGIFDASVHEQVMTLMRERRDARAAGCYAYVLHDFVKQGPPLLDLTRTILDWQGDNETTNGFLHYALIIGVVAALDARDYDLVRRAHDAASWIADPPIEPDDHARGRGWKNPLESADIKARLDHVLSGKAEEEKQKLRAAADAARAAGKPNLKITDEQLGQLAETTVLERVAADPKSGEVWFRDGEKRLRYFDGFAVGEGGFTARAISHEGVAAELADATAVSERGLWWDRKAENFRDVVRLGRHVLLSWGVNNGAFERYVVSFTEADAAAAFTAKLRANPPKGYAESEPYYVPGKGAVVRTYYAPKEGGGDRERRLLWLLDSAVSDEDCGSPERAVAEHLRREAAWLRGGGVMSTLEWSEGRRRPEDMTVREWIKARSRDDRRDPRWHLAALTEIGDYLRAHDLAPKRLVVELDPPAPADAIDAFAASRKHPLPESLRALWSVHGGAHWQLGPRGMHLLQPAMIEERRPRARAAGDAYLEKLPPDAAAKLAPIFGALDILVETSDGEAVTYLADIEREDGRVFSHAAEHPNDFWWESSLSWMIATRLLSDLEAALAEAVPEIDTLKVGERPILTAAAKSPTSKQKPAAKPAPPAKKPAAKKPAAKKPAAKKPATKPATKKPAAKSATKPIKRAPKKAARTKPTPKKR